MIDLHAHILPGVDDGASSLADSLAMAEQLASVGITRVVATPHLQLDGRSKLPLLREKIELEVARLNEALGEKGIPLEVLRGAEVLYTPNILQELEKATAAPTLGSSSYLLLELNLLQPLPPRFQQDLFLLQTRGFRPVLAHPERCTCFLENPKYLHLLARQGLLYQVTMSSLSGYLGKQSRRLALELARSGLATFMGTDAHAPRDGRISEVPRALSILDQEVGVDRKRLLTETHAQKALDGEYLEQVDVSEEEFRAGRASLSVPTIFRKILQRNKRNPSR